MATLKQLLKKKNPSGKELGIIEVANTAIMFKQQAEGKAAEPIIDLNELQGMINGIKDPVQKFIYNGYMSIHEWLSLYYNIGLSNEQQAQLRYKDMLSYITEASISEDIYSYISRLPAIMTQKQYDEAVEQGIQKQLYNEAGEPHTDNIADLFMRALDYYLAILAKYPRRKNPLKPVKRNYLNEAVTSPIVLSRFNRAAYNGYYQLPDGRRSDEMNYEEWMEARTTTKMRRYLDSDRTEDCEEAKTLMELEKALQKQRILRIWNDGIDQINDTERNAFIEAGFFYKTEWVPYENPPENLRKWHAVEDCMTLELIYPAVFRNPDQEAYKEQMADFSAEFSELIDAIAADIDAQELFDFKVSEIQPEAWRDVKVPLQELYDMNFCDFAEDLKNDKDTLFMGNHRAFANGIAILQESDNSFFPAPTDDKGHYLQPYITHAVEEPHRLDGLFPASEYREEMAADILLSRTALIDSYYYMKGFNMTLDMITEHFEIPELEPFKLNLADLESKIDYLNERVFALYARIFRTKYEENKKDLKDMKLQVLKDHFGEIDYKSIEIPEKNVLMLKELFENFKAFKDPLLIEDLVLYRTLRPGSPFEGVL